MTGNELKTPFQCHSNSIRTELVLPSSLISPHTTSLPTSAIFQVHFSSQFLQPLISMVSSQPAQSADVSDGESEESDDSFLEQPRDCTSKYKRIIAGLSDDIEVWVSFLAIGQI